MRKIREYLELALVVILGLSFLAIIFAANTFRWTV